MAIARRLLATFIHADVRGGDSGGKPSLLSALNYFGNQLRPGASSAPCKDVSFEVAPGEMVGIVGRSGSGKSTMVNLLGRFYDVQEGAVLVDGIDVRNLSMQSLRENLGIVFQDSFLFRGTIWKNLSFGRPQSTIEEALVAAKAAGAHDFILRQSLGYETLLGEHGAGLSGGEKQRLSIARTLLYDPKVLILDEATSNIDAEAERSIQEALEVLVRGRTTIAIAHRLSTLRNADRILVFDRGRLIEHGTHAELLSADGTYARLVRIQTQVSKDPNVDKLLWNAENTKTEDSQIDTSFPRGLTQSRSRTILAVCLLVATFFDGIANAMGFFSLGEFASRTKPQVLRPDCSRALKERHGQ